MKFIDRIGEVFDRSGEGGCSGTSPSQPAPAPPDAVKESDIPEAIVLTDKEAEAFYLGLQAGSKEDLTYLSSTGLPGATYAIKGAFRRVRSCMHRELRLEACNRGCDVDSGAWVITLKCDGCCGTFEVWQYD